MKKFLLSTLILGILVAGVFAQDTPSTRTYNSYEMGLSFDYPSSWKLVEDAPAKKGGINLDIFKKKKKKAPSGPKQTEKETLFYIPVGDHTAKLEIFSALYDDTPELWETIQSRANEQLKREVQKQWREEILGVPLLLTKIGYDDVGQPTTVLTGLVYSRTPRKMQFRLTAPTDQYADAEYAFRQALQSLHTIAGEMPQPEDPNHPLDKSAYAAPTPQKATKITSLEAPKPNGGKIVKGAVALPVAFGERKAVLTFPAGWTGTQAADGSVALTHPGLNGSVTVTLFSSLDSDAPQSAILKASAASLDQFKSVSDRKEVAAETSLAGASTDAIWRTGVTAAGPLLTCDAVGATGDYYWMAKFRREGGALTVDERKLLDLLIDGMSLDPTP